MLGIAQSGKPSCLLLGNNKVGSASVLRLEDQGTARCRFPSFVLSPSLQQMQHLYLAAAPDEVRG